jgi:hypothetical protein
LAAVFLSQAAERYRQEFPANSLHAGNPERKKAKHLMRQIEAYPEKGRRSSVSWSLCQEGKWLNGREDDRKSLIIFF